MNLNPITAITGLIKAGGGVVKTIRGSKADRDQQFNERYIADKQAYSSEFNHGPNRNIFDSLIDGLNRLPRPLTYIAMLYYIAMAYKQPTEFQILNVALETIPEVMWQIILAVIGSLFVTRELHKSRGSKLAMSKSDFAETQRRIAELKKDVEKVQRPVKDSLPLWYLLARTEMDKNTKEISGEKANPEIVKYHSATTLQAKSDEIAWCSAFVNWCVKTAGFEPTNMAKAQSWLEWGKELKEPEEGCIVVFKRGKEPWMGHVGFYVRTDGNQIMCLGGNQGNEVNISGYHKDRVLGYRTQ